MKSIIKEIFTTHYLLRLATIDEEGLPDARSIDFVHHPDNESIIYFTTFINTNKVSEIAENNNVYVVIDKEANSIEELAQLRYVRGKGTALRIENAEESQSAMGLLLTKYPYLKDLPGDPSMMSMYKIELKEIKLTDNTKGFGHVETITY